MLGAPFDPAQASRDLLSGADSRWDRALEGLFNLCESDPQLRHVMDAHGATRETLRDLYKMLVANGAGQWVQGHYVAASAFAFGFPLIFLLENAEALHSVRVVSRLLDYFEIGEVGPILG